MYHEGLADLEVLQMVEFTEGPRVIVGVLPDIAKSRLYSCEILSGIQNGELYGSESGGRMDGELSSEREGVHDNAVARAFGSGRTSCHSQESVDEGCSGVVSDGGDEGVVVDVVEVKHSGLDNTTRATTKATTTKAPTTAVTDHDSVAAAAAAVAIPESESGSAKTSAAPKTAVVSISGAVIAISWKTSTVSKIGRCTRRIYVTVSGSGSKRTCKSRCTSVGKTTGKSRDVTKDRTNHHTVETLGVYA